MGQQEQNNSISIMAVGDIMMGRKVSDSIKKNKPGWIFSEIKTLLSQADITIGNLETPIINTEAKPSHYVKTPLKASEEVLKEIKSAQFSIMNVANNHILDYGSRGLINTLDILKDNQINYTGAGRTIDEARRPLTLKVKRMNLTFLSYCSSYNATPSKAGTAPLNINKIKNDIIEAKKNSDLIIVSLHHGVEYSNYPTPGFIKFAHQIIDFGAQVILCHHPHVLQGIEEYNQGIIAYSLGNFVFDLSDKEVRKKAYKECVLTKKYGIHFEENDNRVSQSIILEIIFKNGQLTNYNIFPVFISTDFRPSLTHGDEKSKLIKKIGELSKNIGNDALYINQILRKLEADSLLSYINDKNFFYYLCNLKKLKPFHFKMILDIIRVKLQSLTAIRSGKR